VRAVWLRHWHDLGLSAKQTLGSAWLPPLLPGASARNKPNRSLPPVTGADRQQFRVRAHPGAAHGWGGTRRTRFGQTAQSSRRLEALFLLDTRAEALGRAWPEFNARLFLGRSPNAQPRLAALIEAIETLAGSALWPVAGPWGFTVCGRA